MSTNQTWKDGGLGDTNGWTSLDSNDINAKRQGFAYNSDIGLRRWRAALARMKAGTNQIINVPVIGDSITEGLYAGGGAGQGTSPSFLAGGYVGRIRSSFATKYGDTGTGFIPTYYPNGAPYWTFTGAGWVNGTNWGTTNSYKYGGTNGDTATMNFNGTGIGVVVGRGSNAGTFTVSIDGGAATSYDGNNATSIGAYAYEITGLAAGAHTVTITCTVSGGKGVYLLGAYPIKGSSGVRVNMCGRASVKGADCATNGQVLFAEIDIWNPPLTIVTLTANDYFFQTPLDSYKSNIKTIIDRTKNFGDCLLLSAGLSTSPGAIPQSEYVNVLRNLALENNIAFIDIHNRWSGDANYAKNTLGLIADGVHPNDYGHQDIATAILKVIDEY